jgi:hypothetical protein
MKFFFWSIQLFWFWIGLGRVSFPPECSLPRARLGLVSIRGITDGDGQVKDFNLLLQTGMGSNNQDSEESLWD